MYGNSLSLVKGLNDMLQMISVTYNIEMYVVSLKFLEWFFFFF